MTEIFNCPVKHSLPNLIKRKFKCVETKKADIKKVQEYDIIILGGGIYASGIAGVRCFYGRGAWNESAMTFTDRTLCKMLQKAVAKQDPSTYEPWQQALMCAVGQSCDWTDKKYLEPVIEFINSN